MCFEKGSMVNEKWSMTIDKRSVINVFEKNFMAIDDSSKEINVNNTYQEVNRLKLCNPLIDMNFRSMSFD